MWPVDKVCLGSFISKHFVFVYMYVFPRRKTICECYAVQIGMLKGTVLLYITGSFTGRKIIQPLIKCAILVGYVVFGLFLTLVFLPKNFKVCGHFVTIFLLESKVLLILR